MTRINSNYDQRSDLPGVHFSPVLNETAASFYTRTCGFKCSYVHAEPFTLIRQSSKSSSSLTSIASSIASVTEALNYETPKILANNHYPKMDHFFVSPQRGEVDSIPVDDNSVTNLVCKENRISDSPESKPLVLSEKKTLCKKNTDGIKWLFESCICFKK